MCLVVDEGDMCFVVHEGDTCVLLFMREIHVFCC